MSTNIHNKNVETPEDQKYDLVSGKTISQVLGEITWMLSQSRDLQSLTMADLEWLVMPPILLRQFQIQYSEQTPVALELFAMVEEKSIARFIAGARTLTVKDWANGAHRLTVLRLNLLTKDAELIAASPAGRPLHN